MSLAEGRLTTYRAFLPRRTPLLVQIKREAGYPWHGRWLTRVARAEARDASADGALRSRAVDEAWASSRPARSKRGQTPAAILRIAWENDCIVLLLDQHQYARAE